MCIYVYVSYLTHITSIIITDHECISLLHIIICLLVTHEIISYIRESPIITNNHQQSLIITNISPIYHQYITIIYIYIMNSNSSAGDLASSRPSGKRSARRTRTQGARPRSSRRRCDEMPRWDRYG